VTVPTSMRSSAPANDAAQQPALTAAASGTSAGIGSSLLQQQQVSCVEQRVHLNIGVQPLTAH
jgi:hypothetical protein